MTQIYNFFNYQIFFKFFFVQKCSAHNYGANIMIISNHQIFNTVLFKFSETKIIFHFLISNSERHCEERSNPLVEQIALVNPSLAMTIGQYFPRNNGYHSSISSYKSFHSGLTAFIKSSFFFLDSAFICFSLAIASSILWKTS